MAKPITSAERRYMDYLRRNGVQTSNAYVRKLVSMRTKEVGRVIDILRTYEDTSAWADVVRMELTEGNYLPQWYKGLIVNGGLPMVTATARQLTGNPKALERGAFERGLADYAERRVGMEITSVTGTLKDDLIKTIRRGINEDYNIGVEKLATAIREDFDSLKLWQARRIAQTEMMGALGEAGRESAQVLDIPFTKQWCISGLGNTRDTHIAMDGVEVDQDDYFILPDCVMQYPHDMSNGTAGEVINCACACIRRPKR